MNASEWKSRLELVDDAMKFLDDARKANDHAHQERVDEIKAVRIEKRIELQADKKEVLRSAPDSKTANERFKTIDAKLGVVDGEYNKNIREELADHEKKNSLLQDAKEKLEGKRQEIEEQKPSPINAELVANVYNVVRGPINAVVFKGEEVLKSVDAELGKIVDQARENWPVIEAGLKASIKGTIKDLGEIVSPANKDKEEWKPRPDPPVRERDEKPPGFDR